MATGGALQDLAAAWRHGLPDAGRRGEEALLAAVREALLHIADTINDAEPSPGAQDVASPSPHSAAVLRSAAEIVGTFGTSLVREANETTSHCSRRAVCDEPTELCRYCPLHTSTNTY